MSWVETDEGIEHIGILGGFLLFIVCLAMYPFVRLIKYSKHSREKELSNHD